MHLFRYEKKLSLLIDLSKFLKIMCHYAFFFRIMQIMCSEADYVILHPCIIPEALASEVRELMNRAVLKCQSVVFDEV